ncbi:hypothetical protein EG327_000815 [Venturia inaequalis]|uniref:Uncharacterized protein n=1 Tax=Venturia inaequalis TaxID=5025 RepID=A0A8H3ZG59_VENIN|nr:hypothetical protein EG327_000815 [Venturia inaequalis]
MSDSEDVKDSAVQKIRNWGESSFPPTLLATLVTAQHFKPFQTLPMLFPPVLLLSSYLNINGFKTDAAGISAAWSGLYLLLAMRRKQVQSRFRGLFPSDTEPPHDGLKFPQKTVWGGLQIGGKEVPKSGW